MKLLKELPDKSVDMVYGDPDYNVGIKYGDKSYTKTIIMLVSNMVINLIRKPLMNILNGILN